MKDVVEQRYDLAFRLYPYARSPDQDGPARRDRVVVVGGGPIGLAMALDLGRRGVPVLLLDDHEGVGAGSRAICFAKRTLEICDRLGAVAPMMAKGVVWNTGKVFHDGRLRHAFDLCPMAAMPCPPSSTGNSPMSSGRASARRPDRDPGPQPGGWAGAASRPCGAGCGHARQPLSGAGRLSDRPRRRAQPLARDSGAGFRRPGVLGQFPDRRCPHAGRFPHRTLALVRAAFPIGR